MTPPRKAPKWRALARARWHRFTAFLWWLIDGEEHP
jgi:hypothetical protein